MSKTLDKLVSVDEAVDIAVVKIHECLQNMMRRFLTSTSPQIVMIEIDQRQVELTSALFMLMMGSHSLQKVSTDICRFLARSASFGTEEGVVNDIQSALQSAVALGCVEGKTLPPTALMELMWTVSDTLPPSSEPTEPSAEQAN
jgi:hypothetical protein